LWKGESIPARVYVLDSSEAPALKKMLEYDPYLDQNLIPRAPKEWDDDKFVKAHPEMAQEIAQKKKEVEDAVNKLRNDKEANIIFARMDYQLRDGISMSLDREKSYLYLSGDEAFLNGAEQKLKKNLKSIGRADANVEKQIIDTIEKEKERSDQGLGFIFG